MLHEFNGPFERALEKAEHSFERYSEELDEECPLCPTEGREPGQARGQARPLRQVRRVHELPRLPIHPEHGRQRASRARDARRDLPGMRQAPAEAGGPVRAVHRLQRLPGLQVHQEGSARLDGRRVSPVRTRGVDREAQPRSEPTFYSCSRYPDCDCAVGNPPEKDHPCPRVRLAVARAARSRSGAGAAAPSWIWTSTSRRKATSRPRPPRARRRRSRRPPAPPRRSRPRRRSHGEAEDYREDGRPTAGRTTSTAREKDGGLDPRSIEGPAEG